MGDRVFAGACAEPRTAIDRGTTTWCGRGEDARVETAIGRVE